MTQKTKVILPGSQRNSDFCTTWYLAAWLMSGAPCPPTCTNREPIQDKTAGFKSQTVCVASTETLSYISKVKKEHPHPLNTRGWRTRAFSWDISVLKPLVRRCIPGATLPPFINHFNAFTENSELCDLGVCQDVRGGHKNPFWLQSQNGTSRGRG